jgi:hypothetical protein
METSMPRRTAAFCKPAKSRGPLPNPRLAGDALSALGLKATALNRVRRLYPSNAERPNHRGQHDQDQQLARSWKGHRLLRKPNAKRPIGPRNLGGAVLRQTYVNQPFERSLSYINNA